LLSHGADSIQQIRAQLSNDDLTYLKALPVEYQSGSLQATHACLDHPTDHVTDYIDANNQAALADRPFLALGHSHRALCLTEDGRWLTEPEGEHQIGRGGIVCPGSVRGTSSRPKGTVCVLDVEAGTCFWHLVRSSP
jgi:predicted phosphodiesterase